MRKKLVSRLLAVPCVLASTALLPGPAVAAPAEDAGPPASASCDRPHGSGAVTVPVTSEGRVRPVLVHVPAGYDGTRATPLVFNLHGSGGTGAAQLAGSGLATTADAHTFIVAAPNAGIPLNNGFAWHIPGVPLFGANLPPADAPSDVQHVSDIIDALSNVLCIDAKRVYATGESGGGRMTSLLGCKLADRIAAIAPVVGLRAGNPDPADTSRPDPATCNPSRPVPVIAFSGTTDTVNPFPGGGQGYWMYGVPAAAQRWAEINHCNQGPETTTISPDTDVVSYEACRSNARVVSHHVIGAGHTWGVADNQALWEFLDDNPLPGPRSGTW